MSQPRDGTHSSGDASEQPERPKEVFRGHFDECVDHLKMALLSQLPNSLRGAGEQRKPIAEFCNISDDTLLSWLNGGPKRIGWSVVRLMCYLDMVGYKVIDIERMQPALRGYFELIGYGILDPQTASGLVEYKQTSSLYCIFTEKEGYSGISDQKRQKMWEEWKARKDELEKKKEELRKKYFIEVPTDFIPGDRAQKPSVVSVHQKSAVLVQKKSTSRRAAVVCMMEALLALLEEKSSGGQYTAFDELRGSTGIVLSLSAQLSSISSCLLGSQRKKGDVDDEGQ